MLRRRESHRFRDFPAFTAAGACHYGLTRRSAVDLARWPMDLRTALVFTVALGTLVVAHQLGDHVLQRDHVAAHKADPGRRGWLHMAIHVGVYHAVATGMLVAAFLLLGLDLPVSGIVAGVGFSAASHALIDRRWPVRWILRRAGAPTFALRQTPVNGMYLADQALHYGCLWISALLIARL
jgi:hypothetical protein